MSKSKDRVDFQYMMLSENDKLSYLESMMCNKKILVEEYYSSFKLLNQQVNSIYDEINSDDLILGIRTNKNSMLGSYAELSNDEIINRKSNILNKLKQDFYNRPDIRKHFDWLYNYDPIERTLKKYLACIGNRILPQREIKHVLRHKMISSDISMEMMNKSKNAKGKYLKLIKNNYAEKVYESLILLFSDNLELQKEIKKNIYLTGNSLYGIHHKGNVSINDYDFFIKDMGVAKKILKFIYEKNMNNSLYSNSLDTSGEIVIEESIKSGKKSLMYKNIKKPEKYFLNFSSDICLETIISSRAITLRFPLLSVSSSDSLTKASPIAGSSIQLIFMGIGPHKQNINRFDFEHCKMVVDFAKKKVYSSLITDYAISEKTLILSPRYKFSLAIFSRLIKFTNENNHMTLPLVTQIEIAKRIQKSNIDMEYIENNLVFYGDPDDADSKLISECKTPEEGIRKGRKYIIKGDFNIKSINDVIIESENKKQNKRKIEMDEGYTINDIPF